MPMPFTADQLREAIAALQGEMADVRADADRRVQKLQARADVFSEMLAELRTAPTEKEGQLPLETIGDVTNLRTLMTHALADGQPHDLRELVTLASSQGLLAGSSSPGRSVHAVLIGMKQNGLAHREESGAWRRAG